MNFPIVFECKARSACMNDLGGSVMFRVALG